MLLLLLQSVGYSSSQGMKGAAVVVFLICSCKSLDQSPTYGQSLRRREDSLLLSDQQLK